MRKDWEIIETDFVCPTCDRSCPYCDKKGMCHLAEPMEDCEDYMAYNEE